MNQSIATRTLIILCFLSVFSQCTFFDSKKQSHYITISDLTVAQKYPLPFKCDDWHVRGQRIVKNTANDTIRFGEKVFAPGQTGRIFIMDAFGARPDTFGYLPYKATKGEIVIDCYIVPW